MWKSKRTMPKKQKAQKEEWTFTRRSIPLGDPIYSRPWTVSLGGFYHDQNPDADNTPQNEEPEEKN
jgi:hypothetical protein